MIALRRPVLRALLAVMVIVSVASTLAACGRKGPPVAPSEVSRDKDSY